MNFLSYSLKKWTFWANSRWWNNCLKMSESHIIFIYSFFVFLFNFLFDIRFFLFFWFSVVLQITTCKFAFRTEKRQTGYEIFEVIEMYFEFSYNLPNEIVDVYNCYITNFSKFKFCVIFVLQISYIVAVRTLQYAIAVVRTYYYLGSMYYTVGRTEF